MADMTLSPGLSLIYSPDLAKAVKDLGIHHPAEASIFINQLAFWIKSGYGYVTIEGKRWIYNSYQEWVKEQFTSLSEWQFGVMIRHLTQIGIVEKSYYAELRKNLSKAIPGWHPHKTTSWITLNVDRLFHLTGCYPHCETKPLPDTEIANATTLNVDCNNESLRSQQPSIYQENSIPTQDYAEPIKERQEGISDPWNEEPTHATHYVDELKQEPSQSSEVNLEDKYSAAPGHEFKKPLLKQKIKQIWEIAPGRPFPVFLQWWADKKYKPQGGKWEADARGNLRRVLQQL